MQLYYTFRKPELVFWIYISIILSVDNILHLAVKSSEKSSGWGIELAISFSRTMHHDNTALEPSFVEQLNKETIIITNSQNTELMEGPNFNLRQLAGGTAADDYSSRGRSLATSKGGFLRDGAQFGDGRGGGTRVRPGDALELVLYTGDDVTSVAAEFIVSARATDGVQ